MFGGGFVRAAPIFRIGFEHHLAGRVEGFDGIRTGTDGLGLRVIRGVLIEHQSRASGQIPQEIGIRGIEREPDRVGIDGFGLIEAFHLVGGVVLLLLELVDGPRHVVGVEFVAIGETHVVVEMERVGLAVLGNVPGFREARLHFVVGVAQQQRFVDVADQHLFDGRSGLVADVEADRGEFEPDGDGVGFSYAGSVRVIVFAARHCNGDDHRDGGDDGDQRDKPLLRALRFRAVRRFRTRVQRGVGACRGLRLLFVLLFGCVGFAVRTGR